VKIIAQQGDYSVRDEREGDPLLRYGAVTLWGPDVDGRICRMASYRDSVGRALQALCTFTGA